eukprot:352135-Chlamydomonas_euryale.AAC.5
MGESNCARGVPKAVRPGCSHGAPGVDLYWGESIADTTPKGSCRLAAWLILQRASSDLLSGNYLTESVDVLRAVRH